jgi:hypothetical protein
MTNRLLVNPGTPQAWEIVLKSGVNRIGRSEDNDFQVNHASVSTHHCEISVSSAGVLLKDLGSTNGTFLNRAPVKEALLQTGQHVQVGGVDMLFEAARATTAEAPIAIPPAPARPPIAVRITTPPAAALRIEPPEPVIEPPIPPPVSGHAAAATAVGEVRDVGAAYCRFHPKTLARYLCESCQKYYCDMCVITRTVGAIPGKYCRTCGGACVAVRPHLPNAAAPKGFFARLPEAFMYPFRGNGFLLLVAGTFLYFLLQVGQIVLLSGGLRNFVVGMVIQIFVGGYLFGYAQTIVQTTAVEDRELPQLAGVSSFWEDVLLPFLQMLGLVIACFSPAFLILIISTAAGLPVLAIAALPVFVLGFLYLPMGFLAVLILDTLKALNPLVIVPSILRVPVAYLVTLALLAGVGGIRFGGDLVIAWAFEEGFSTKSMAMLFLMLFVKALWCFAGYYLLIVTLRILGLLYVTKKQVLGWLDR